MMKSKLVLFLSLLSLALPGLLQGQAVPGLMSYQGFLVDGGGNALGAGSPINRKMIFRIFDSATGGTRIWSEEQTVTVADGNFSVVLGQGVEASYDGSPETPRPSLLTVFGSTDRYLEVVVDNGDETLNTTDAPISPRQRLISSAFAVRAHSADNIATGTDLQLNGSSNYGLGYYGGSRLFNGIDVDGPVLYGNSGGVLGSNQNGTQNIALNWDGNGNVGIGNTTPGEKLDVTGNIKATGQLIVNNGLAQSPATSANGGDGMRLILWPGTSTETPFGFGIANATLYGVVPPNSAHAWYGGTTEYMRLRGDNGNLGVGTSNPQEKVDVFGNIKASGELKASSVTITGGIKASGTIHTDHNTVSHGQGAHLEWNKEAGGGKTYLLNQRGTGAGGIVFGDVDALDNYTETLSIETSGKVRTKNGVHFPGALEPTSGNWLTNGNYISFGHVGVSEDFLGYSDNTFWLRDSALGGDVAQPNLDVGGDIKSGGTVSGANIKRGVNDVVVAQAALRIVRGSLKFNPTNSGSFNPATDATIAGEGFTVSGPTPGGPNNHVFSGTFLITFSSAFADVPVVTATINSNFDNYDFINVFEVTKTYCKIQTQISDGGNHWIPFSFIAIGK
ncbi:MAG: hypothetical protein AAGA58_16575 [Verrucomicrobiota bacterium]